MLACTFNSAPSAVGDLLKTIPDTGRWEVMLSSVHAERRANLKPVVRGKELQTQTTTDTFSCLRHIVYTEAVTASCREQPPREC